MKFQQIGAGPTVVLLPGLGCDARLWEATAARLSDRYTLVTPEIWESSTLARAAEAVAEVITGLGAGPVGVAGVSMGGYVVFELLRNWPQRIRAAALFDSTPYADPPDRAAKRRDALLRIREGRFDAVLREYVEGVLSAGHAGRSPARRLMLEMARGLGAEAYARCVNAILERGSYEEVLRQVRVPTLFAAGELDALTPPDVARRAAAEIPGARTEVVPGAGHLTPLEAPEAVADLLGAFFGRGLPEGG